jgi:hypothetical protein
VGGLRPAPCLPRLLTRMASSQELTDDNENRSFALISSVQSQLDEGAVWHSTVSRSPSGHET